MTLLLAAAALVLAWALFEFWLTWSAAPFLPTSPLQVELMVEFAVPKAGETWIDLGSGDGRVLFAAAAAGAKAIGYELSPLRVWKSRRRAAELGLSDRVEIRWGDLWSADLRGADVVSAYLVPYRMGRLQAKLEAELRDGCRVVVNSFPITGWTPREADEGFRVFLYLKAS